MSRSPNAHLGRQKALVIGTGIAGLATAARLAHEGFAVTVLERHATPGGKMRCLPSPAGPVDAGPTVLTLRPVIEMLFAEMGERLEDHVSLVRQPNIARHFWPDGSRLDLYDSPAANIHAIRDFAGAKAARQFRDFTERARVLFAAFDGPMMRSAKPSRLQVAKRCITNPHILFQMAPMSSLAGLLDRSFDDPRLSQLFARYATYIGGTPERVPALLSLIWHAEQAGVWKVRGGMHKLAQALASIAQSRGAEIRYNSHVNHILHKNGLVCGVALESGPDIAADLVVFNGDPRAIATGSLGPGLDRVAPGTRNAQRSLSAQVWAFAAKQSGPELVHHNVFFRDTPGPEFAALRNGQLVDDPTLYICAMDRGSASRQSNGLERFEIIANAPPLPAPDAEFETCQTRTFKTLARFGLTFDPVPTARSLTTPTGFELLFPASLGSIYGQSPEGLTAAFQRPTAQTPIKGLFLVGGGAHPGAGVPMAILSASHAVETIMTRQTSISPFRPTATRGGTSTA